MIPPLSAPVPSPREGRSAADLPPSCLLHPGEGRGPVATSWLSRHTLSDPAHGTCVPASAGKQGTTA